MKIRPIALASVVLGLIAMACGSSKDDEEQSEVVLSCERGGEYYEVGESFAETCGGCECLPDTTWGNCTGTCPEPLTCEHEGARYPVGGFYSHGCTSCMCLPDGSWGHCTGACL